MLVWACGVWHCLIWVKQIFTMRHARSPAVSIATQHVISDNTTMQTVKFRGGVAFPLLQKVGGMSPVHPRIDAHGEKWERKTGLGFNSPIAVVHCRVWLWESRSRIRVYCIGPIYVCYQTGAAWCTTRKGSNSLLCLRNHIISSAPPLFLHLLCWAVYKIH